MKKRGLILSMTAIAMAAGLMAGCTNRQAAATAQTETAADTFNPDKEAGVSIGELREKLGDVPKLDGEVKLGAVAKSFDNEYQTKAAAAGYNITIDVTSAQGENDEQGQLSIVKDMINKKYTGLLLSPISDGNLTPGVEDAKKAGIPVINVNDGLIANADSFVGPKADQNGELAAEWIADKLGGKGKVAIVIGMPKAFAARQRTGWRPMQRILRLWQSRMLTGTARSPKTWRTHGLNSIRT